MSRRGLGVVAAAGALGASFVAGRRAEPGPVDQALGTVFSQSRGVGVDRVVGAVTDVGSVFGIVGVSTTLALSGDVERGLRTAAAGSLSWVVAQGAKTFVDRRRPYELGTAELLISVPHGSSWPSGHTAVAAAMAATLAPALPPARRRGAWALAAVVGATRLHVGAHHASDVVAGAAIGVLGAGVTRHLADALLRRR